MLISFAVTNFRSIRERMEINTLKTGSKGLVSNYFKASGKRQMLKSAVLYGPNASGKSGFLTAFNALRYLVNESAGFKVDESIAPYEPHRLEKSYISMPTTLEISFINRWQYDYIIVFNDEQILQEELHYYPGTAKSLLYSRFAGKEIKFGDYFKGPKKTLEKITSSNQLLLSKAAENNAEEVLLTAFRFFTSKLRAYPVMEVFHEHNLTSFYAKRLAEDKEKAFTKRFNAMICALDTGISSVSVEEVDWNNYKFPGNMPDEIKKQFQEDYKYDIKTQHFVFDKTEKIGFESFDIRQESAGTQSLFAIGGIILDALNHGRVLIIDEFEKNLHPNITGFLIQLFHNPVINKNNAQLIFATHDITQLSNDRFRRDQVWFTQKNEFGATSLYRCSDIEGIRLGTPLDKWYASGRFGATPIIHDADFLIEMQSDEV
ncbi:ATP-binding protein [Mucilaginibacter daejeonensis]|uniref:AAA family ATPase n=1 Tax=Mucilaginibacter daejeonensis TaxID=398049 RepID=UPI001D176682|nr:ATP-binding protein [Mucilaginibacter daejeonensis]UEG51840.1 ATP-binding protein [Mucilaginibacter daejeonensis]